MHNILKLRNNYKPTYLYAYIVMLLAGVMAFIAAFTLSVEKIEIIKNPDAILSCSINVVLNCASVMKTWQSEIFGFPNSFIGVAGFAIVIALAIGGIFGNKYTKAYLSTAQFFFGIGLLFSYWLFFESVYVIQTLCPWCLLVTLTTTLMFEALLHINLRSNNFNLNKSIDKKVQLFLNKDIDKLVTAGWLVILTVLVLLKFGDALYV